MIKINDQSIDLVVQTEEHTPLHKILDKLSLDIDNILVICPELFFQLFIHLIHDDIDEETICSAEEKITSKDSLIHLMYNYKGKSFRFYFIVTTSETKSIRHPFYGEQEFKTGFKTIKVD